MKYLWGHMELLTLACFWRSCKVNKDLTYRLAIRKDYSDGFRKNIFLNKSDTSKKDESTFRLKVNWELMNKTTYKFLYLKIELDDPADIWTIDGSLNTLSDRPGMDSQKTNALWSKNLSSI